MALTLDVLTPAEGAKGIGVILVSSGGWRSAKSDVPGKEDGRRNREHWVQGLLQGGYTVFVTRHGSAPRYFVPEMVEDIRRSVRFVRHEAGDFTSIPEHLGITSGSSGGHLALMVATTGDDGDAEAEIRCCAVTVGCKRRGLVPPTDLVNWGKPRVIKRSSRAGRVSLRTSLARSADLEAQLQSISPIDQVTADDPPLLLIHGDKDRTVPLQQSEVMQARYQETELPVELIVQAGGGHT